MVRRGQLLIAMAAAVATAAAAALVLFAHDFQPYGPAEKIAQVVTDGIWIAAGLVAWSRRPGNRVGLLMTALGFVDLVHFLYWDEPISFTISQLISFWQLPVTVHLFLAFPSGRLSTRFERGFVTATYVVVALASVLQMPFWDWQSSECPGCPRNVLATSADPDVWAVISPLGDALIVVILATATGLVIRRFRRASALTRRAIVPVLLTAAAAALALIVVIVADAFGASTEGSVMLWVGDVLWASVPLAFLFGLLRMRWHRTAVANLVVELGSLTELPAIRDALARTLGDQSVELAYWLREGDRYVDASGRPTGVGEAPDRAVTMIEYDGRRVAALMHDPALLDDPGLLEAVGAAASLVLENARLQAELRAQLAEVRASRMRLVQAGDVERRRLERDLHDGAQQRLLGVRLALQLARGRLSDETASIGERLAEADTEVVGALEELRALARGIRPAILTEQGLAPALASLARRSSVPVDVTACSGRMPPAVEATTYFVAAESLTNVVKHAHASRATITLARANGSVSINVSDDGVGGADAVGSGLSGLRDRVEALDGTLVLESPSGGGTRVSAVIPCA